MNFADERRLELGLEHLDRKIKHLEYLITLETLDGPPLTKKEQEQLRLAVQRSENQNRKAQRTNEPPEPAKIIEQVQVQAEQAELEEEIVPEQAQETVAA